MTSQGPIEVSQKIKFHPNTPTPTHSHKHKGFAHTSSSPCQTARAMCHDLLVSPGIVAGRPGFPDKETHAMLRASSRSPPQLRAGPKTTCKMGCQQKKAKTLSVFVIAGIIVLIVSRGCQVRKWACFPLTHHFGGDFDVKS